MSTTEAAKSAATSAFPVPRPIGPDDHIYLIDGSTFIFRAYFAMFKAAQARGRSFTRSDGTPVGAVMTFCNMLWKILREGLDGGRPTHVAVIFDHVGGSFRNDLYDQYKANRDEPPEELVPQFPLIRKAVRAFSLLPIEQEGYEADDLIATYACIAAKAGAKVTMVSGDKDLMQLVGPSIGMFDPMPGNERRIGHDEVVKKFGVAPERVVDVQALSGDSTDNIPGVPGIGVKTAAQLIEEYGDLDTLLEKAGEIKQKMRRERLLEFADQARLSRELVRLKTDVPVQTPLEDTGLAEIEAAPLLDFMAEMEFTTLAKRVATAFGAELPDMPAARARNVASAEEEGKAAPSPVLTKADAQTENMPAALAAKRHEAIRKIPVEVSGYETVTTAERLQVWADAAFEQGYVCVNAKATSPDPMRAELTGIALALEPAKACYIPVGHRAAMDGLDFDGAAAIEQVPLAEAIAILKPLFEADHVLKIGENLKYDIQVLRRNGIRLAPIDDTMLMSYALDCGLGSHGMDELSERHLGHKPISFKDVAGSGRAQVTFDRVPVKAASEYAGEEADLTLRLWNVLAPRLPADGLTSVYQRLERPLIHVLADMEYAGIKVEAAVLRKLSGELTEALADLEKTIYGLAGESFNVGSTKQLSDILFGKLGYPGGRKTGKGAWSTGANVLEDLTNSESLTDEQRQLPLKLLDWRQLSKLKSTYTDTLPSFIHPETGRVHTCYALGATSTGRLASTEPNLQNIPIRTAEGRKIRMAFIAEPGHKLISADYSQIELRVLAHIADIGALKKAFAEDLDIHAMTASEMFGVPIKNMPPDVRRRAKAINFGIIYGISAFGLANNLGISRSEAADYIARYFERFPGIRDYMETTKEGAREKGYVETIFGRRIHFPDISSSNRAMRSFFERAAINAPIQGTAADIIRRAMIRMPRALEASSPNAKMLLQVHDELVFEAPDAEVDTTIATAVQVMENSVEPAAVLSVPLKVDARAALNWDEAH